MIIDNGKFVVHNIIVSADSYFYPLLHQKTGDAVGRSNLGSVQIDPYLYPSFLGIYKRKGNFFIGEGVHCYIDEGLSLVYIFNDFFLRIVREGEVDFGFGQSGNRYSDGKDND
jgi:hypothetical protein